jgi:hypothetical protein
MDTYFPIISNLITHNCLYIDTIKSYLEIGVRDGDSLKAVIQEYINIKEIVLSDNWGGDFGGSARGNNNHIKELLLNIHYPLNQVTFLNGDSQVTLPKYFIHNPQKIFDFCFIDGGHSIVNVCCDLGNTLNHSLITAIHDVRHPAHTYIYELCLAFYRSTHSKYLMIDDGAYLIYFIDKSIIK